MCVLLEDRGIRLFFAPESQSSPWRPPGPWVKTIIFRVVCASVSVCVSIPFVSNSSSVMVCSVLPFRVSRRKSQVIPSLPPCLPHSFSQLQRAPSRPHSAL